MGVPTPQTWASEISLPVALEVLRRGPISRSEIAQRLQLSPGSLTRLSAALVDRGVLLEVGEHNDGRVGRPRRLLDVRADAQHFIGMKLRESEAIAALTNLRGEVLASGEWPLADRSPDAVVGVIAQIVDELRGGRRVHGIGVGIGGIVQSRSRVSNAPFLGWSDLPLAQMITEHTGIDAIIDNDVAAFTEYERWFGDGRDTDRFAVVTLGAGTGFGLVANGGLVVNEDYGIGLIGHWPLDPSGPLCPRGHRGCATSILNSDAIARHVSQALDRRVDYEQALELAASGQPAALRVFTDAARGVGRILAAICNLTLPERIIIGGEGVGIARVANAEMIAALRADRDPRATTPPIIISQGDNVEWSRGAAVLAIQAFVLGAG